MQHANYPPKRLRSGVFEADPRIGELTKHGKRLPLQEQPFQLLSMLLERPGELVSREELRARIWPETIVDFDHGLNKAISKIREALGDSAENPRFIETVASRGYRFLADVAVVADGEKTMAGDLARYETPDVPRTTDASASAKSPAPALSWRLSGTLMGLAFAIFLSWFFYSERHPQSTIRSLAVLPLVNL